jgi:membrane-associated protein
VGVVLTHGALPADYARTVLAALIDIPPNVGYAAIFALIAVETMGVPVPGETALIAAALLAHDGQLDIVLLCIVASAAAIIGDNVGFAIGRKGGRKLFARPGPFLEHRLKVLELGEPFFAKHGPKAVFLGRWVSGLRIASAWLAGMNKMSWPTFLFWNALGGIVWATAVAVGVYLLGHVAEDILSAAGPIAAGVVVLAGIAFLVWRHRRARRVKVRMPVDAPGEA